MTELSAPARLGAFGVGLLVVLAASFGVGRITGDVAPEPAAEQRLVEQPAEHGEMGS